MGNTFQGINEVITYIENREALSEFPSLLKNSSCRKFENGFPLKACGNDGFLYANVNSTWLWRHMGMHDLLLKSKKQEALPRMSFPHTPTTVIPACFKREPILVFFLLRCFSTTCSIPMHGNTSLKTGLLKHLLKIAELKESDLE
jgi:hypothetical protein